MLNNNALKVIDVRGEAVLLDAARIAVIHQHRAGHGDVILDNGSKFTFSANALSQIWQAWQGKPASETVQFWFTVGPISDKPIKKDK